MRDLQSFVEPLIAAYAERGVFVPGAVVPTGVAEACAVHDALIDAYGPVGGFKVIQKAGLEPAIAPIPARRCLPSGSKVETPASFGVELEVGFVVVEPLPARDVPDYRARLIAAVRPAPMIEVVATRVEGPLADDRFVKLADLQACEALVSGDTLGDWTGADFETPTIEFTAGTDPIHLGAGQVPGGSAIAALETAALVLGDRYGGLQVGHRLLTGTLVPLAPTLAGQTITGKITGLGEVVALV